jgi:hypothetical protein
VRKACSPVKRRIGAGFSGRMTRVRLVLRIRHIRKDERLASFRQRDPCISQPRVMFALFGVVCFLRQRCVPGGRFRRGLALGSHLVVLSTTRLRPNDGGGRSWPPPSPLTAAAPTTAYLSVLLGLTSSLASYPTTLARVPIGLMQPRTVVEILPFPPVPRFLSLVLLASSSVQAPWLDRRALASAG